MSCGGTAAILALIEMFFQNRHISSNFVTFIVMCKRYTLDIKGT